MAKSKKEKVDNEDSDFSHESAEKQEYRRIIELYKAQYPEKWENGKREELETKLNAMV